MFSIPCVGMRCATARAPYLSTYSRRWNATSRPSGQQQQQPKQDGSLESRSMLERMRNVHREAGGFVSSAESKFAKAGAILNRLTGYEEIQGLKRAVIVNEQEIKRARTAARTVRKDHEAAAKAFAASQDEWNALLVREPSWKGPDHARFSSLRINRKVLRQKKESTAVADQQAEAAVEKALSALTSSILARYHEEQVWSDKIRKLSTYGQLGGMAVSALGFILALLIVEPWKRRRLGEAVEKRVEELEQELRALFEQSSAVVRSTLESQGHVLQTLAEADKASSTDDMDNELALRELVSAAQQITERRRRFERLETFVISSLGGAIGVTTAFLIISVIKG